jgi:GT2 family glycosyltransferase
LKTSVIIPSYNPTLKLAETLEKLVPQAILIYELIIIIDSDNYGDFAKSLAHKYSPAFKIKIYPQPNSGRAKSRNKGAEICSGDIIIFLDDDMLAEKDLIEKHIQYHLKNPGIILSGNGYRNPECAKYDFGKYLINVEKIWKKESSDVGETTFQKFNFTACNLSLPKKIFQQLGGFDTHFSDAEDFDFAVRAIKSGIRIIYDRTLLAWHNDWPEIDTYIKRQNEYLMAKKEIQKLHPDYLEYFPYLQSKQRNKVKRLFAAIIRTTVGKWVISKNSIFGMLPISIKFFLYRISISSNLNINK